MSKWYDEYVLSEHWERTKIQKLLQANIDEQWQVLECEKCKLFVPLKMVDVHHLHYKSVGREQMEDLAVYCRSCHRVHHGFKPALWWEYAQKGGMKMILQPQVNRWMGVKRLADVMCQCLAYADERMLSQQFREIYAPKHPARVK